MNSVHLEVGRREEYRRARQALYNACGTQTVQLQASDLLAAREQMAFTLGFHIVLSCLGVALPATILVANYIGLKRGDGDALELAKRWSKAMAVRCSRSSKPSRASIRTGRRRSNVHAGRSG